MVRVFRTSKSPTCLEDTPLQYQKALIEYRDADPIPTVKALAEKHQVYQGTLAKYIVKFNLLRTETLRSGYNLKRKATVVEQHTARGKRYEKFEDLPQNYQDGINAYTKAEVVPSISQLCTDFGLYPATLSKYLDQFQLRREPYMRQRNVQKTKMAARKKAIQRVQQVAALENSKQSIQLDTQQEPFVNKTQSEEKQIINVRLVAKAGLYEDDPDGIEPKFTIEPGCCSWVILLAADNKNGIDESGKWKRETLWCGREKLIDSPYCSIHHRRAYRADVKPYQKPLFPDKAKARQI